MAKSRQDDAAPEDKKGEEGKEKVGCYEYYEATVSLVKAIAWPVVAFYFFLVLRGPIVATVEQLPNLFYKTTHITIAGVTLEIDQRVQANASPQLREALSKLSAGALRELVHTGEATHYTRSSYTSYTKTESALRELDSAGLIRLEVGVTDPQHTGDDVRWKCTEMGEQAYTFVVDVVIDQLLRSAPADCK